MINTEFWLGKDAPPPIPSTVVERCRAMYESCKHTCSHIFLPRQEFLQLVEAAEKCSD